MRLSCQQFRTEFIRQSDATILPKVTMRQFFMLVGFPAMGVFFFGIPIWFTPFLALLGWIAGFNHNGETILWRVVAFCNVWGRTTLAVPRTVNIQAAWDQAQKAATQAGYRFRASVTVHGDEGAIMY